MLSTITILYATTHMTCSETEYAWGNLQQTANVNCNKFPEICLKEFRHVSQQRAGILNIFYDDEYNIDYYIWIIINERSKQCVLTVTAAHKHFYRQVTQRFRGKLPIAKSVSNQPALWAPKITFPIAFPTHFNPENGGRIFFQNIGICL
jgi:hypothetical protein